ARHYAFHEIALLALGGEAPSVQKGALFAAALSFGCRVSVAEAPVHAASLARRYTSRSSGVSAVAAIGLAESARRQIEQAAPVLGWLESGCTEPFPEQRRPADDDERRRVEQLREVLRGSGAYPAALDRDLAMIDAVLICLWLSGLRQRWQLEAALVWARFPLALAEAFAPQAGALGDYPINLPRFQFVEEGDG